MFQRCSLCSIFVEISVCVCVCVCMFFFFFFFFWGGGGLVCGTTLLSLINVCLPNSASIFFFLLQYACPNLRLFSHDGKVRILNFNSRCAFWIKIQNTQKRPCVCQITSQNVIWNAHLKSRYRGVFQLRFSQITQRNLCMNDLTSESCFGGRS